MDNKNGTSSPGRPTSVMVENGRGHIESLLGKYTPNDEETAVLVDIMAALHSVLDSPVYGTPAKGTMMGNALRAAFNYGRLQGQAEKKAAKRPLRPKVRRK